MTSNNDKSIIQRTQNNQDIELIKTAELSSDGNNSMKKTCFCKIGPWKIEFFNLRALTLQEHLQVVSVATFLGLAVSGLTAAPVLMVYLLFYTRWWFLVPIYIAWLFYDWNTPFKGGRKWKWFAKLKLFKYVRDYFPIKLVKTAELSPDRNYLLVVYPHGFLSVGMVGNFASAANEAETEVFPGLEFRCITLNSNVIAPITRECALALGACSASESSITYLLESKPAKAVVLIAGGMSENVYSEPGGTYSIILNRRKGFVRLALKTGTSLVPVFSFGETNLYDRCPVNCFSIFRRCFGVETLRIPNGRGFLQNSFGILPKKAKITTVVGKPIPIPKLENPTPELISEYHAKFVEELKSLFEEYKGKYDVAGSEARLILAE